LSNDKPRFGIKEPKFTYDEVIPGLFQGDFPERGVDWTKFDDIVTMTAEDIPAVKLRLGGLWMYVPIWDSTVDDPDAIRVTAKTVADRVAVGKRVLVHCAAGLNRSGIVSARALMYTGYSVTEAIAKVRAARGSYALCNTAFVKWLYAEAGEPVPLTETRFALYDYDEVGLTSSDDEWDLIWRAAVAAERTRNESALASRKADVESNLA